MENRLSELLIGKRVSYILPFFWQQGESEEILREYMGAIDNSGIYEVCVESRPHPDFNGPGWWHDMDIIMDEARKRGMRVWLLDDSHFPTGYANGAFKTADPSLCLQFMNMNMVEAAGPTPQVTIDVEKMSHERPQPAFAAMGGGRRYEKREFDDDERLAVLACLIEENDQLGKVLDLTDQVKDGRLVWDVPAGYWRIYVAYLTHNAGMNNTVMNIIDRDSVRVLLDAIYEPEWQHYKDDFGKTFAGFFSDEPCFRNTMGFGRDTRIGRLEMPLPWNKQVPGMLAERLGAQWMTLLPHLWHPGADADLTARVRYAYMDTITELVKVNFSNQLGEWCAAHGVEYVGHAVEDNNSGSHLGSSLGHFFRALDGQHMAGIDEVILQVVFAGENSINRAGGHFVKANRNFYHYALGKLASSHAHIDPKKQGRSLCEIWGASGWAFGVRAMKYVANHFLVRGVNRYTPHAFNPDKFPAPDGPPHFYAHGENPQYRHFGALSRYMQRVCHLIDGGLHVAEVAVLYSGEADWVGDAMFEQYPVRRLTEHQIDFDIIPADILAEGQHQLANGLVVNGERYKALIIPGSAYIRGTVADFCRRAQTAGLPVFFVGYKPSAYADRAEALDDLPGELVALNELAPRLRRLGIGEVSLEPAFSKLVYYHYRRENDLYVFANEAAEDVFDGWVSVPQRGDLCLYDPWENVLRPVEYEKTAGGTRFHLRLAPYELCVVAFGAKASETAALPELRGEPALLKGWKVSMAESKAYPQFTPAYEADELANFGERYPDFSGFIAYETEFAGQAEALEIADAYEGVEVWCNGVHLGMRIAPPFVFDMRGASKTGRNTLRIEVATNLDRKVRALGVINRFNPDQPLLEPTGIVGEVRLYR